MTSTPSVPTVAVATPDGDLPAHLWLPESGRGPGVLLLQEIFGISRYLEQRAADLAALGYVVLAPEIFWRLGVRRVPEGPDMLEEAMALLQRVDWDAAVGDAAAAFDALAARPEVAPEPAAGGAAPAPAVLGFCFGGGLGFHLAAVRRPSCLVSYYGSALPGLLHLAPRVTTPSLHHFGLADGFVPRAEVERVRDAVGGPETVFETYEGADHAFDNPDLTFHHPEASERAWERTVTFLAAAGTGRSAGT